MMLKEIHHYPFRPSITTLTLLLFFGIQGYGGLVFSADYRLGGVNPEALLCRPEGKARFRRWFIITG